MLKLDIRSRPMFLKGEQGFSLTELIVVMSIFVTVMLITSKTFNIIVNQSSQLSKSIETQIEGVVGLEVLRADLEQAGFGLPWTLGALSYAESNLGANMPEPSYWPSGDADTNFNDATNNAPRAVLSANTNFNIDGSSVGAKYLVIKSTTAATNATARKWTNISYANGVKTLTVWGDSGRDFASTDWVTIVKNNLNTTPPTRQLVGNAGAFSTTFSSYESLFQSPPVDGDTFQIYGVGTSTPRMPFNRADYYIRTPSTSMPQGCARNTGILYKANISHGSGAYAPFGGIPLVDCVADMQVSYGLDTDNGGRVNFRTDTPPATAELQRAQLREVRVDILAQDGKMDRFYTYPSNTVDVGDFAVTGRRFDLPTLIGAGWQNYRWKVYTIVVRPKNLIQ